MMRPFRAFLRAAAPVLMAFALIGCDGTLERSQDTVASASARTAQLNNQFYSRPPVRASGAQTSGANFVAPEIVNLKSSDRLPASAETSTSVVLISRNPLKLKDIAARLSEITKIQHSVELGPNGTTAQAGADAGADAGSAGGSAAGASRAGSLSIRPSLRGSLSSVLDKVGSAFDVEWTYKDGRVVFRDYVTRQYQLSAMPVTSSMGFSAVQTSSAASLDMWEELERGLDNVAGPNAQVEVGQGTGILTVTALLSDQERIRDYVSTMNQTMGQQIAFDVNVLTVTARDAEGYGVDLQNLSFANNNGDIEWIGGRGVADSVGTVNVGIISGDFNLDAAISALSTRQNVTIETRAGATTTNFQMIPVEVVEETAYVSEVSVTLDAFGNPTQSITTDTVVTGFQMQLLPRVLNTREVLLRYSLDLSDLLALETFESSDSTVQLPEVTRSKFEQQVILKNGQTLVLSGFERQRTEVDREGVGSPRFLGLGGVAQGDIRRASNIVFITPRILSRNLTNN
jgi:type II secretory pathway component GspD/PulD (secretin)